VAGAGRSAAAMDELEARAEIFVPKEFFFSFTTSESQNVRCPWIFFGQQLTSLTIIYACSMSINLYKNIWKQNFADKCSDTIYTLSIRVI
jgi:hypothetical protein